LGWGYIGVALGLCRSVESFAGQDPGKHLNQYKWGTLTKYVWLAMGSGRKASGLVTTFGVFKCGRVYLYYRMKTSSDRTYKVPKGAIERMHVTRIEEGKKGERHDKRKTGR